MSYETSLTSARHHLHTAQTELQEELRAYPTPVSGCDAQYTYLLAKRHAVAQAIGALDALPFIPTPRTLEDGAGVESR